MTEEMMNKMTEMSEALNTLAGAWDKINTLWSEPEIRDIMDKTCDIFPFDRSFDEMNYEVADWAYCTGNELQKRVTYEKIWGQIEDMELSMDDLEGLGAFLQEKLMNNKYDKRHIDMMF